MKKSLFFFFLILLSSFALADYATSGDHNFAMLPIDNAFSAQDATGNTFNITTTSSSDFATDGTNNLPMELFYEEAAAIIPPVPPSGGGGGTPPSGCVPDSNHLILVTPLSGNSLKADGTPSGSVKYNVKNISNCDVNVGIGSSENIGNYLHITPSGFVLKPDQNRDIEVYSTQGKAIEPFAMAGSVVFTANAGLQQQIIEQAINLFRDWWWIAVIIVAILVFLYFFFKRKKKPKTSRIPALTGQPASS